MFNYLSIFNCDSFHIDGLQLLVNFFEWMISGARFVERVLLGYPHKPHHDNFDHGCRRHGVQKSAIKNLLQTIFVTNILVNRKPLQPWRKPCQ